MKARDTHAHTGGAQEVGSRQRTHARLAVEIHRHAAVVNHSYPVLGQQIEGRVAAVDDHRLLTQREVTVTEIGRLLLLARRRHGRLLALEVGVQQRLDLVLVDVVAVVDVVCSRPH